MANNRKTTIGEERGQPETDIRTHVKDIGGENDNIDGDEPPIWVKDLVFKDQTTKEEKIGRNKRDGRDSGRKPPSARQNQRTRTRTERPFRWSNFKIQIEFLVGSQQKLISRRN